MKNKHDSLPQRQPNLFHRCWNCNTVGLKPGILGTKYGDYGMRDICKKEKELKLNETGVCADCANTLKA